MRNPRPLTTGGSGPTVEQFVQWNARGTNKPATIILKTKCGCVDYNRLIRSRSLGGSLHMITAESRVIVTFTHYSTFSHVIEITANHKSNSIYDRNI